jgi:hypothetical protein
VVAINKTLHFSSPCDDLIIQSIGKESRVSSEYFYFLFGIRLAILPPM